jgi:hypothetical protein
VAVAGEAQGQPVAEVDRLAALDARLPRARGEGLAADLVDED